MNFRRIDRKNILFPKIRPTYAKMWEKSNFLRIRPVFVRLVNFANMAIFLKKIVTRVLGFFNEI